LLINNLYEVKPAELSQQKQALSLFVELESEIPLLHNQVNALGWKQRNELVEHVYSNYNNHDDLNDARSLWETEHTKLSVLTWIQVVQLIFCKIIKPQLILFPS